MRDLILISIIIGSVPLCIVNPYIGVLFWYWISYFVPQHFTWSYAYDFPVALVVAVPTLAGAFFARKSLRGLWTRESILLFALWIWYSITYLNAKTVPFFAGHMSDADYEMTHISKILLMSFVMILFVFTRERLRGLMLVTGGSLGLLAVKGALFGLRTGGASRVWGPPDSFLADNNAFALALNMCLPILYYLAQQERRRWTRLVLRTCFVCSCLAVLLTYSRGGLLGLAVVMSLITLKSRHRIAGACLMILTVVVVISFAPPAWMDRMGQFVRGNLDTSADERLVSWGASWNFAHDYPIAGGGFDALPDVNIFQRYQQRPLPDGFASSGPHSIYFQLLADHGFVGLGLFLGLMGSCFWSLWRLRWKAKRTQTMEWLVNYTHMIEVAIVAFMASGAFLGFVYLDVIYQMIGIVVILKLLFKYEWNARAESLRLEPASAVVMEQIPA
jgi:putative inorganic carbon (hco3(-)) transporter